MNLDVHFTLNHDSCYSLGQKATNYPNETFTLAKESKLMIFKPVGITKIVEFICCKIALPNWIGTEKKKHIYLNLLKFNYSCWILGCAHLTYVISITWCLTLQLVECFTLGQTKLLVLRVRSSTRQHWAFSVVGPPPGMDCVYCLQTTCLHSTSHSSLFSLAVVGLRALLSRYLEGNYTNFLNEWMNELMPIMLQLLRKPRK